MDTVTSTVTRLPVYHGDVAREHRAGGPAGKGRGLQKCKGGVLGLTCSENPEGCDVQREPGFGGSKGTSTASRSQLGHSPSTRKSRTCLGDKRKAEWLDDE